MRWSLFRAAAAALLLAGARAPAAAQLPDTVEAAAQLRTDSSSTPPTLPVPTLTVLGSTDEELARIGELHGRRLSGSLLRSTSRGSELLREPTGFGWAVLAPELRGSWNSEIPYSLNEGLGWSGRGISGSVTGGVGVRWGPATLIVAPEFAYSENRDFVIVKNEVPYRSDFSLPWFTDTLSLDMPIRYGDEPRRVVGPGQSSLSLSAGALAFGVATENHWWGPGIRNAIVLSNNAPGFPHLFLRTSRPLSSGVGSFDWVWLVGRLTASEYFDERGGDDRSLSGFAATYTPRWDPNFEIGVARVVYSAVDTIDEALGDAGAAFFDWSGANELERTGRDDPSEQLLSIFGRWIFPANGLEVYGEWGRYRLPVSLRDLLTQPNHTQGFTAGMQWAPLVSARSYVRLQLEATNLERSATYRLRPIGSYYSSLEIPEGYTHQGRVLGAAIGPGSSSQWGAVDYHARGGTLRAGVFGGRTRWNNDAYFRSLAPWLMFGHDVTVFAGVRAGWDVRGLRVSAEFTQGNRMNFLFQNFGAGWDESARAVDVTNRTLRLTLTPLLLRRTPGV